MRYLVLFLFLCVLLRLNAQLPIPLPYEWQEDVVEQSNRKIGVLDISSLGIWANTGADISTDLQNIIDNNTEYDSIYMPSGEYFFGSSIALPSGAVLFGDGTSTRLFFEIGEQTYCIGNQPSKISTIKIENNIEIGDSIFSFNDTKYPVGTAFYLKSTDKELTTSSWADESLIQFNKIKSISPDSTSFVSLYTSDRFRDMETAELVFPDFTENIEISNLKIIRLDKSEGQTSNIRLNHARNCRIKCIESESTNFAHVRVEWSQNIEVIGSYFHGAQAYGGGGQGYGVVLQFGANECTVADNIFDTLRHSILLQAGAYGNVISANYSVNPFWTDVFLPEDSAGDLVLHGNWVYNNLFQHNIAQNIVIDDSHGSNGPGNMFFRNRAENYGIFMNNNPASDGQIFIANEITSSAFLKGLYLLQGTGHIEIGNIIRGEYAGDPPATELPKSITATMLTDLKAPYIGNINSYAQAQIPASLRYAEKIVTSCDYNDYLLVDESITNHTKSNIIYLSENELIEKTKDKDFYIYDAQGRYYAKLSDIVSTGAGLYYIVIDNQIYAIIK